MKRYATLLLTLCLLVGAVLLITGCDKVSEKDVRKDPAAVLTEATDNTLTEFFADAPDILGVLAKALEDGKLSVSLAGEDIFDSDEISVKETLYFNAKNDLIISDTEVMIEGKTLAAQLFINKQRILAQSESLLGDDTVYGLDYQTFVDDFKGSDLADALGVDNDTAREITDFVEELLKSLEESKDTAAKNEQLVKDIFAQLSPEVREETFATDADSETDGIVLTLTLDNKSLDKIVDLICDALPESIAEIDGESIVDMIKDAYEELDDEVEIDMTVEIYFVAKTNTLAQILVDGTIEESYGNDKYDIEAEIRFGANEIELSFDLRVDNDKIAFDAVIERENTDKELVYEITAKAKNGSYSVDLFGLEITYEKESGDWEIALSVDDGGTQDVLSLEGNLAVKKDKSMTLTVTQIKTDGEKIKPEITISAEVGAKAPSVPKDFTNVLELDERDLEKIGEKIVEAVEELMGVTYLDGTYEYASDYSADVLTLDFDGSRITVSFMMYDASGSYSITDDVIEIDIYDGDTEIFESLNGSFSLDIGRNYIVLDGERYDLID